MPKVIVSGALANKPHNGGNAWTRLSWVLGFARLGYETYFVEQIDRAACVDAQGRPSGFAESANVAYFQGVADRFGLGGRASLVCTPGGEWFGVDPAGLAEMANPADLLFNISGHLTLEPLKSAPRLRVYYDDDPGFTQFWQAAGSDASRLGGHDFYYTVGLNVGSEECPIPTGAVAWRHTLPPVVMENWPAVLPRDPGERSGGAFRFTTVASWRGPYGPVHYDGKTYGLKAHQFRKYITLPAACGQSFEIALDIHPNDARDRDALNTNGWRLADPRAAAAAPDDFRRYVQESDAEFSVAQGVYVDTRSGWFSDRTTRYLASGKPALVQDTGFSDHVPSGRGLVAFSTMEEAVAGAKDIVRHYGGHRRAARALAEAHFDSDKVIARLLEEINLPHAPPSAEGMRR